MKGFISVICSLVFWQIAVCDRVQLQEFFKRQSSNETFVRLFREHLKHFQDDSHGQKSKNGVPFPCQKLPAPLSKPTSVHKLTPMDVKVVAGMGDSITAGMGIAANNILTDLIEFRGLSWSIGGNEDIETVKTVANILKVYNPDVIGYSTGSGPYWWEPTAHLNVADSGAKAEDMPGQAELLVKRMKSNSNIDFDNDWKIITLFVGGNDLCDFCEDKEKYGAESYKAHIQEALDYLHANIPRAFVNLVEVLPISVAKDLNQNLLCDVIHFFGCRCAAYPANSEAEAELNAETQKYRDILVDLVNTGRYDTRDDFTAVIQPFFSKTTLPKKADGTIDLSYFAPDCFHLSLKGHAAAADALWNNMVEPVGKKRIDWLVGEKLECPTNDHPFFYTYKNSNDSALSKSMADQEQDENDQSSFKAVNLEKQSETHQEKSEYQSVTLATIIGAVIGALCVVCAVGILVWRKRKARNYYENLSD